MVACCAGMSDDNVQHGLKYLSTKDEVQIEDFL